MRPRLNWPLWIGLLLAPIAFVSYFAFFALYPVTRDVPWASFLLFALSIALLVLGWVRAPRKVLPSMALLLGVLVFAGFTYLVTLGSKNLPPSAGAPAVGETAPDFTLSDANGRPVTLSRVLAGSNGALLVFYRGYW